MKGAFMKWLLMVMVSLGSIWAQASVLKQIGCELKVYDLRAGNVETVHVRSEVQSHLPRLLYEKGGAKFTVTLFGANILLTKIEAHGSNATSLGDLDLSIPEEIRSLKTTLNIQKRWAYAAYCNAVEPR